MTDEEMDEMARGPAGAIVAFLVGCILTLFAVVAWDIVKSVLP